METASNMPLYDSRTPQDFARFTSKKNRVELVGNMNAVVGPPTPLGVTLQTAFLFDEMEPADMIEFAKVCLEILDTKKKRW
ncbi:hypothetical protein [Massilia sp. S19_KUP03_FR1]|uniref:hypothetical protein n=1 Tax=Massilia sp. S19_KUP03_FR1 TaxID=3025503 RepID=UPI002FCD03B8